MADSTEGRSNQQNPARPLEEARSSSIDGSGARGSVRGADPSEAFDDILAKTAERETDESELDIVPLPLGKSVLGEGDLINDRYVIERVLARGGVGFVLRAKDRRLDRTVAIKLLLPQYANAPRARARFELEAKVAVKIDSEHIPRIIDVGELADGAQFMVMEHLTGEDLSRMITRRKRVPLDEAIPLMTQMCTVVGLAHDAGIIHRDLKPANVFVTTRPDGSPCVKILDFGVAKLRGLNRPEGPFAADTVSSIVGTPRYMAPEQITGSVVDGRVDIWALGAILYELLSGRRAFDAPKIPDVFKAVMKENPVPLPQLAPGVPPAMEAVVLRCFEKDPANRYPTARALADALLQATPPQLRPSLAKSPASRVRYALVAAGVVAAAAGLAYWFTREPPAIPATSSAVAAPTFTPLKVGFVYVGVPEDAGWTGTHDRGRKDVAAMLPWLETDYARDGHLPGAAEKAVDDFMARGFDAIVANSFSLREAIAKKAKQYPDKKFLIYSYPPSPEVGAFGGRLEQAWYLAGFAAAARSKSKRLGFVGSLVTPEVVRYLNAFTRGARRRDPSVVVEVQWIGFWFDTAAPDDQGRHKEELLASRLLANGADVVAHNADNSRVVAAIEASRSGALSIANNDPKGCDEGKTTCLGAVAWNWAPLYRAMFEDLHRGVWKPETRYHPSIHANPEKSTVNFFLNDRLADASLRLELGTLLGELASDPTGLAIFDGPWCSTGQREACLGPGVRLTEQELRTMCFYVEGVVEKSTPDDPASADKPARVPTQCTEQQ